MYLSIYRAKQIVLTLNLFETMKRNNEAYYIRQDTIEE